MMFWTSTIITQYTIITTNARASRMLPVDVQLLLVCDNCAEPELIWPLIQPRIWYWADMTLTLSQYLVWSVRVNVLNTVFLVHLVQNDNLCWAKKRISSRMMVKVSSFIYMQSEGVDALSYCIKLFLLSWLLHSKVATQSPYCHLTRAIPCSQQLRPKMCLCTRELLHTLLSTKNV